MKRNLLCWLLIFLMAVGLMPFGAFASDAPGLSDAFIDPVTEWNQYDQLIRSCQTTLDTAKRAEMLHQAEDLLMSTGCVIPLYYFGINYLLKTNYQNVFVDNGGAKFFAYAKAADGAKTMRICLAGEPETLDPALNSAVDVETILSAVYSGLYGCGLNGEIGPACAKSCTVSADGRTYRIKLKDGLKWSDGSALTAADFVFSWKRAAAEKTAGDYGYLFDVFEGYPNALNVQAPDSKTLTFTLKSPCPFMKSLLAFPTFFPVKQSAVESNPSGWWKNAGFVSNGPFTLTEWKHGNTITLTKNPSWYDSSNVSMQTLELTLSDDSDAMLQRYQSGALDFLDSPNPSAKSEVPSEYHSQTMRGTYYLAFNAKSPIFAGKNPKQAACMRLAMSLLIDRNEIADMIGGQIAANTFVPRGMSDGNGGIFHLDNSPGYYPLMQDQALEKAREMLRYAGFSFDANGKLSAQTPLKVRYALNEGYRHDDIADCVRNAFSKIGIQFEIITMPWEAFANRDPKSFDLARGGWVADYNDPIGMLEMWTTDSANNVCCFDYTDAQTTAFSDVSADAYYAAPISWAVNHTPQITNGTGNGRFSPETDCTRGQIVTFLWRAKGEPKPKSGTNPFVDVKPSDYFYTAVLWAIEQGITNGTDASHFSPNISCTRGQSVTFLWRAEGRPAAKTAESEFSDVKDSGAYFYTPVLWAVENGITNGTGNGRFSPDLTCTRGQIVTFLWRDLAR